MSERQHGGLIRDEGEFPSNSHSSKKEPTSDKKREEKKVEKIVTGTVVKQKKSLGKRFSENFLGEDSKSVGEYIVTEVLVPNTKDLIVEIVKSAIEMFMWGERRSKGSSRHGGGKQYTSYGSYFSDKSSDRDRGYGRREMSRSARARHDFDEILITDRGEAEEVLSHMYDLCEDYGMVSVADFYDMVGVDADFTDQKYGWTDMRGVKPVRVRGGFVLDLPRAKPLD